MIEITDKIALDETEIAVTFIRASGPGGQNVNKVSSAAQLRFDVRRSPSLPDAVRLRLERVAARAQEANRRDAIGRLVQMIRQAAAERPVRRPTRPTLGAEQRRLSGKAKRGKVKRQRRTPGFTGD